VAVPGDDELHAVDEGGMVTALARSFTGVRYEEYGFEGGAYLGFSKSHDVDGDGSIVVVPAARFPEVTLVPAHEARGFADMPALRGVVHGARRNTDVSRGD
jgi:hypothetical protein